MKRTLIIVSMILALAFVGCGASSEERSILIKCDFSQFCN